MYTIGIDPGWRNLGIALSDVTDGKGVLLKSKTLDPSKSSSYSNFLASVSDLCGDYSLNLVCIERYVPFKGMHTPNSEEINKLIGALCYFFEDKHGLQPQLFRSIEWKTKLAQELYKTGNFKNPSTSLDKKFSLAAAAFCCNVKGKITDHEADAVCLSYYPTLLV